MPTYCQLDLLALINNRFLLLLHFWSNIVLCRRLAHSKLCRQALCICEQTRWYLSSVEKFQKYVLVILLKIKVWMCHFKMQKGYFHCAWKIPISFSCLLKKVILQTAHLFATISIAFRDIFQGLTKNITSFNSN